LRSLSDTIARLSKMNAGVGLQTAHSRLSTLVSFGSNPGGLDAQVHIPASLPRGAGLVVVLHGCTQTAAAYDHGSGWSRLADEYGFAVLYPQQSRANNANLCFNWFVPADVTRGSGEALSIAEMIETVCAEHPIDRRRVFITGLSAGGAMANAMLATYPELFSSGAIIAGLPYGVAATIPEAFDRMRGHGLARPSAMQASLRAASDHQGPWPTISIWHGTADHTVAFANADAIREQWNGVHGLKPSCTETPIAGGHTRSVWQNAMGNDAVETYTIAGMAHGTPLDVSRGTESAGPFMLNVGLSSTRAIARSWGLTPSFEKRSDAADPAGSEAVEAADSATRQPASTGIQRVIEDALRAAGLMR
jgi:poly(hydroxyalkanoate) depolymerase family esterase